MRIAHEAGRKVAFTLSDIACIKPHRAEMMKMLEAGAIDLLFANENEIMALADMDDRDAGDRRAQDKVPLLVVTCGAEGAMAVEGAARRRADRAARHRRGRHDRRGRPVRGRLPVRPAAGGASRTACASARSRRPK